MVKSDEVLPPDFDPELYRRIHPDVRRSGINPALHYLEHGRAEGRSFFPTHRRQKLLSFIDPDRLGLEIGPSHSPICPKAEGYNVEILDHASQDDLKTKYAEHGVDLNCIEPVDFVWRGDSYKDLTGRTHEYHWVVASHVIEHTPDLIRFIQNCEDILHCDGGALVLAIPDKRYCFDHLRPTTSLASVIDAYESKRTVHSVGTAAEYCLNVCRVLPGKDWGASIASDFQLIHSRADALALMQEARNSKFNDLHAWCFTPSSFRLMVVDLCALGLIRSVEIGFFDTVGHEFIIAIGERGAGPNISRMALAVRALEE
jgi:2-polyprenyl-3-methyl-5-hydroxy-6-metoxy-1,4-benzoquinol methylase